MQREIAVTIPNPFEIIGLPKHPAPVIEPPATREKLAAVIGAYQDYVEECAEKFRRIANHNRRGSRACRALAISLLALGLVAPLFVPSLDQTGNLVLAMAYAAIAAAVIVLLIDQVFVLTESFLLFATCATDARALSAKLAQERLALLVKTEGPGVEVEVEPTLKLLKESQATMQAIEERAETTFAERIREGIKTLRTSLRDAQKDAKNQHENAAEPGAITVTVDEPGRLENAHVTVGSEQREWESGATSISFGDLPAGLHKIVFRADLKGGDPQSQEGFVKVRAGEATDHTIKLPPAAGGTP